MHSFKEFNILILAAVTLANAVASAAGLETGPVGTALADAALARANCERLITGRQLENLPVPLSERVRSRAALEKALVALGTEFPGIMRAPLVRDAVRNEPGGAYALLDRGSRAIIERFLEGANYEAIKLVVSLAPRWVESIRRAEPDALTRSIVPSLLRTFAEDLLRESRSEAHFAEVFALARALDDETGEYERFARHLLTFRAALVPAEDMLRPTSPVLTAAALTSEHVAELTRLAGELIVIARDPALQAGIIGSRLGPLVNEVRNLRVFRAEVLEPFVLNWEDYDVEAARILDFESRMGKVAEILRARPEFVQSKIVSRALLDLLDPAEARWYDDIGARLRINPGLADDPAFERWMKDDGFFQFATSELI